MGPTPLCRNSRLLNERRSHDGRAESLDWSATSTRRMNDRAGSRHEPNSNGDGDAAGTGYEEAIRGVPSSRSRRWHGRRRNETCDNGLIAPSPTLYPCENPAWYARGHVTMNVPGFCNV
eukprot:29692-Pelagococcus_subviridis.AAC.10